MPCNSPVFYSLTGALLPGFHWRGRHLRIVVVLITSHHLPIQLPRRHSVAEWERVEGTPVAGGLWLFLGLKSLPGASEGSTRTMFHC